MGCIFWGIVVPFFLFPRFNGVWWFPINQSIYIYIYAWMAFGDTAINLDKFSGDQWWILVIVGGEMSWGHHVVNPLPHPQYQQKWVGIQRLSDNYPQLMIFGVRYFKKKCKLERIPLINFKRAQIKSGWWFQPLWEILVSWDYYCSHILWTNKKCSKPPTRNINYIQLQ